MQQKFKYIQVTLHDVAALNRDAKLGIDPNEWGEKTHVARCVECGRYTEDPTRDYVGNPLPDYLYSSEEAKQPICEDCGLQRLAQAFEHDTLALLEERLGLVEGDKERIRAIKSLVENPDRVLRVERLHDKVDGLERRLNDKADELKQAIEAKIEGANTRLHSSSLWINGLVALVGFLAGVLVTQNLP